MSGDTISGASAPGASAPELRTSTAELIVLWLACAAVAGVTLAWIVFLGCGLLWLVGWR
jgi:hypothetical protein